MMYLDQWQQDIIEDRSKYILLCKGRQIGGTSTYAEKAVKWMVEKGSRILVGSITEEQAKYVIVMVYNILFDKHKEKIKRGNNKPTQDRIQLKNGGEIRSRPVGVTGDAFRGFTADVNWFNEASKWPEIAFAAIMPTLMTTGGEIWMDSTPYGKGNFFHRCFVNKTGIWKVYYKMSEEVIQNRTINEYWTKEKKENALKYLNDQKREMSSLQYKQEYLGLFLDELRQVFNDDLIQKCMVLKRPGTVNKGNRFYLGVDIARMGEDETTFEIIDRTNKELLIHVEHQITKRTLLTDTFNRILELDRIYDFKQIFIDDGGMGVGVFDMLLSHEQTRRKTIAINNSYRPLDKDELRKKRVLKEDIYNNMLMLMEQDKLKLLDDAEIFQSLKSVQFEITAQGVKYFGNYMHIADGLVRAAWSTKDKSLNIYLY